MQREEEHAALPTDAAPTPADDARPADRGRRRVEAELLDDVGVRARRRPPGRPAAGGLAGGARRPVAALGADAGARERGQGAPRLLPVDGVPDRAHARQRAGRARPRGRRRGGAPGARPAPRGRRRARARRRARQRRPRPARRLLPRLDGDARPARRSATASATSTACSRRRSATACRSSTPTRGSRTAAPGSSRAWRSATRCTSAAGSSTAPAATTPASLWHPRRRGRRPRPTTWSCPGTAPTPSARCACGRRWRRRTSTSNVFNTGDYARAATAKNEYENISWVLYPNDSTAGRARAAPAPGVLLRRRLAAGHHRCGTCRSTAASPTWPRRWRSTSTTRTRRSPWPS